ncbi:uncharacterized protein LOC119265965 [Pygocentrus nattereri]|uniref:uncharacterized protein LOC119265964 n=1 Tax=Pygocentrus nattereri TaxID=42514 RepID=UPI001891D5E3|nr:uncharacterized protein LOC119265964 [Pygocentrus nattereri]XP_037402980.1 uncharacterized protein LOC108420387 [Pygocentrus nattereri]XP_037402981.1 uncharacterized protein LOC119265965 [Pygocentrus nattereri]
MAWWCESFWILVTTLCVLRDASGYGVWHKGPLQDQARADVSVPLPQFLKPGLSYDGAYVSRTLTDGGNPKVVSGQSSTSSSLTADVRQDPRLSQPVELHSQVSSSVPRPASDFVGKYQPVFQNERLGGVAPQSQLLSSSRDEALTLQQQGGFWALTSGQSGRPQLANVGPSPSQPQRFSDQLAYDFPAGQGHKSLSPPKNLGGGLTSSSQGHSGATYSSPSWYNPQAVSQSRPGPLAQLKARLFTSQGAPVTSSSVRPASDFAQQAGGPYLTVPSQGATWWPSRRFQHGFQDAPSQVPSAPSGQHGGLVSRFSQYSPASPTSRADELSRGLSSAHAGGKNPSGFSPTGSVVGFTQPQRSPVAEVASVGSSALVSLGYSGFPSPSSTGDAYSGGPSDHSYFRPASYKVSGQRDPSVKG